MKIISLGRLSWRRTVDRKDDPQILGKQDYSSIIWNYRTKHSLWTSDPKTVITALTVHSEYELRERI